MNITLPRKKDSEVRIDLDRKCFVVIGANGSGKTRFGYNIEEAYPNNAHRISAQKSLSMPDIVSTTSKDSAEKDFLTGHISGNNKLGHRWGGNPQTFLLNDYEKLMVLLHTDEYDESIKFKDSYQPGQNSDKPVTKLDIIKKIWEEVLPYRKLVKKAGKIEAYPTGKPDKKYNGSAMSDGERIIFYMIGEVVSVPQNALIIIDEPEMHIHKSVTKTLWNLIERERHDCTFIYLTHDIDFATSRENAAIIWLKDYDGEGIWDYEILDEVSPLPEQVYLEILGSRKPILFIEGDNSSIDYYLYQLIYPEFTATPLGGCQKVFEATKSFNELKNFHHLHSVGIIDRDRRTDDDVRQIREHNILVPEVAEADNLLLLETVVKIVAKRMFKDPDYVFNQVKENVISLFKKDLQYQATQHSIFAIKRTFERGLNPKVKEFEELNVAIHLFLDKMDYARVYKQFENAFQSFVANNDYESVLKVFNNKGIIQTSDLLQLCGLNTKNDEFLNFLIGLLKENSADSKEIRNAIRKVIEVS